ncbi:MAG: hypothetical protein ACOYEA_08815 [Fermentimonas sp.]|jgi:FtsZ-binding cell division protein ZapB
MPYNEDKDKTIALLRKKLEELKRKNNALEQENALLNYEIMRLKRSKN